MIQFSMILSCGVIAFEIGLAFVVGELIKTLRKDRLHELTTEEYDDQVRLIIILGSSTSAASLISRFLQHKCLANIAANISSKLRSDLLSCFFKKCAGVTEPIDEQSSQRLFSFNELQKDLELMSRQLTFYLPWRLKHKLAILVAFICCFLASW